MKFELTLEQANLVIQALAQMPYHMTASLIAELQKQAAPQMTATAEQPTEIQ